FRREATREMRRCPGGDYPKHVWRGRLSQVVLLPVRRLPSATLGHHASQKAGTTSTFSPGPITRSAPLAQTESFNNNLNVSFSAPGAVHRQVLRLTHSQGTPRSQLKPGP